MKVMVAIPWRAEPGRELAHSLTLRHWAGVLPEAQVVDVDSGSELFSRAGSRNEAVRQAERAGAEVVVIGDADTLVDEVPLGLAIEGARTSGKVHLPYVVCRSLGADGTAQYCEGVPLSECDAIPVYGSCGGIYVTTPSTWWAHGGQDERFRGWGFEDVAWVHAHVTLLGEPVRHEGNIYPLDHPVGAKEVPLLEANYALLVRYEEAAGNPEAMRALIAESAG
ncbi:hypothetical protein ACFYN3_31245 [Streptomyces lavendulae]|uniref:hypothetical protein n=1 Tax=Streptomyces lavendulae TaxID=1914 RepID=UPI0036846887